MNFDAPLPPHQVLLFAIPLRYSNPPDLFAFMCLALEACIKDVWWKEWPERQPWLQYGFSVLANPAGRNQRHFEKENFGPVVREMMVESFGRLEKAILLWRDACDEDVPEEGKDWQTVERLNPFFRTNYDCIYEPYHGWPSDIERAIFHNDYRAGRYTFKASTMQALADSVNAHDMRKWKPTLTICKFAASLPNVLSIVKFDDLILFADKYSGVESRDESFIGHWAAKYVESYDRGRGFVVLKRGNQRRFEIPPTSKKAWDILEDLFTTNEPKGLVKLPRNWSSHFNRKIGSTSVVNKDSDVVKIAKCIHPHTAGKGRGSDGLYYFKPIRT